MLFAELVVGTIVSLISVLVHDLLSVLLTNIKDSRSLVFVNFDVSIIFKVGSFDLDTLPWHVFDVPGPQLHLLPINDVYRCLFDSFLIHFELLVAVCDNLVVLTGFLRVITFLTLTA